MSEAGFKATKAEADAALSATGKQVKDAANNTFYLIFDRAIGNKVDLLITVEVNNKTYGITSPAADRKGDEIKLYFSLGSGRQIDFVDGAKKESDATAKVDLSSYSGTAKMTLYRTDKQTEGVYPTGLVQLDQQTIQIQNAKD